MSSGFKYQFSRKKNVCIEIFGKIVHILCVLNKVFENMQDSCQRFQDFSHWVVAHGILKKKETF